jgi:alginate O-acetyltransferase complex protein AlgI
VYIPLGGNRKGLPRQIFNLMIVWALTGLWHGASWNFVVWGMYYGVLLTLEKLFFGKVLQKLPKVVRRLFTFLIASIGWGIFYFTDFSALGVYFGSLIGIHNPGLLSPTSAAWCLGFLPTLLLAAVASTPLFSILAKKLERFRWFAPVRLVACVVLFVLCIASLASQSYNPFIYFRF